MAFSYSFHLSSKSHAVTSVGKVQQCSKHNLRSYKSASYDVNSIEILRGNGVNILEDFKRIYSEEFDEALKEYNQGKRADRRIENYLEHISESRADVGAEIIIQVGDQDFWNDKNMEQKRKTGTIFAAQLSELEKLCPNFKIASAVVHYDEKSPHMHIVGVPVADGYVKGLKKQVAKTKIFTKESLSFLQDKMREHMEKCLEMNKDIFEEKKLKKKEKGRNKDIPKAMLSEYYELKKEYSVLEDIEPKTFGGKYFQKIEKGFIKKETEYRISEENYEKIMEYMGKAHGAYKTLMAQKKTIAEAEDKAEGIIQEAKDKAEGIIQEAKQVSMAEMMIRAKKEADLSNQVRKYEKVLDSNPGLKQAFLEAERQQSKKQHNQHRET